MGSGSGQEMSRNGLKLRYCLKFTNKKEGKIHFVYVQPERRRREGLQQKKKNAQPSSPFLWFNLFSVLFSFLFVQIFPYGQVDRLFHISHGAIPPSLMVLLKLISHS